MRGFHRLRVRAHWACTLSKNLPPGSHSCLHSPEQVAAEPLLSSQGLRSAGGELALDMLRSPQPPPGSPQETPGTCPSPFFSRESCSGPWRAGSQATDTSPPPAPSSPLPPLCSATVDSAEVWFLSCRARFLRFFLLSFCLCLSLLPLPALPRPRGLLRPRLVGCPPGQGRPDGGAILGLRAFGTG